MVVDIVIRICYTTVCFIHNKLIECVLVKLRKTLCTFAPKSLHACFNHVRYSRVAMFRACLLLYDFTGVSLLKFLNSLLCKLHDAGAPFAVPEVYALASQE